MHSIATDSKGNIYTTETYRGQRLQKFVYKGLAPVTKQNQGTVWPTRDDSLRTPVRARDWGLGAMVDGSNPSRLALSSQLLVPSP